MYIKSGRTKVVYAYGMTLFLTPYEYGAIKKFDMVPDATPDQIMRDDEFYDESCRQNAEDMARLRRIFDAEA